MSDHATKRTPFAPEPVQKLNILDLRSGAQAAEARTQMQPIGTTGRGSRELPTRSSGAVTPMLAPAAIPPACTSAAAVRTHAVEPAMELLAISERELDLYRQLFKLRLRRDQLARDIAGFSDTAAERLDRAERAGAYPTPKLISERPDWQAIANYCRTQLRVLTEPARRREHPQAREALHSVFEAHGAALFESETFRKQLTFKRTISLRGEFDRWQAS
jgi:hypothetical protein